MEEKFIYVIEESNTGNIKVGISGSPEERLKTLQTGNPRELKLTHKFEGSHRTEADIHKLLQKYNIKGEWFKPPEGFDESLNQLQEVERKHMKMCSFRLHPKIFEEFKEFCKRNDYTIQNVLTTAVRCYVSAEKLENSDNNGREEKMLEL